jgi:hypothetical protein
MEYLEELVVTLEPCSLLKRWEMEAEREIFQM